MIFNVSSSELAEPPGNTCEQGSGETPTAVGNMNVLLVYGKGKDCVETCTPKRMHNSWETYES